VDRPILVRDRFVVDMSFVYNFDFVVRGRFVVVMSIVYNFFFFSENSERHYYDPVICGRFVVVMSIVYKIIWENSKRYYYDADASYYLVNIKRQINCARRQKKNYFSQAELIIYHSS
jgi:hypothetical protein